MYFIPINDKKGSAIFSLPQPAPGSFEDPFHDAMLEPLPLGPIHSTGSDDVYPLNKIIGYALESVLEEDLDVDDEDLLWCLVPSSPKKRSTSAHSDSSPNKRQKPTINEDDRGDVSRFRPHQDILWHEQLLNLSAFEEQHGHCNVPITFHDQVFARWVKRQRYQYKMYHDGKPNPAINAERIELLDQIGFTWDAHAAAWQERFHELAADTKEQGNCPSHDPENIQLSTWAKCQRRQYKLLHDGKPTNMTPERIEKLNLIGFVWSIRNKNNSK